LVLVRGVWDQTRENWQEKERKKGLALRQKRPGGKGGSKGESPVSIEKRRFTPSIRRRETIDNPRSGYAARGRRKRAK